MNYSQLYENGLYSKCGEPLEDFFKRLDEKGGWPEGNKVCYKWLDMRKPVEEVSFQDAEDELNIIFRMKHSTFDQYIEYRNTLKDK